MSHQCITSQQQFPHLFPIDHPRVRPQRDPAFEAREAGK